MRKTRFLGAATAALALLGAVGLSQIQRMDSLEQMMDLADNAVVGVITNHHVFRVDHPIDGPELYFTTITIEGRLVGTETDATVDVTFLGGFIDEENGVHNSEMPSYEETKPGRQVVAFYKWQDDLGGEVSGNGLTCGHGGVYRMEPWSKGTMVYGRGKGYAISRNTTLSDLDAQMADIQKR